MAIPTGRPIIGANPQKSRMRPPHLADSEPEINIEEFRAVPAPLTHVYRWDRQGRKGQLCRVTARGKMNSIRVEFADGYVMITSGNAIRRVPPCPSAAFQS